MRQGQRRYTPTAWRRKLAQQESLALRHLYRTHGGHIPHVATTRWELA